MSDDQALTVLITAHLDRSVSPEAMAFAERFSARPGVLAVLFYGARIRDKTSGGPYDFYILSESDAAYHARALPRLANRLLPPNVYHELLERQDHVLEAKLAVMSLSAFQARVGVCSRDTTIWARFCQPSRLIWARDRKARDLVVAAIAEATRTAAWWAGRLAPDSAIEPEDIWRGLFASTYGSELRVEKGGDRSRSFMAADPDYFLALAGLLNLTDRPAIDERMRARKRWARISVLGKLRNMARLVKAAFTYAGGVDYALAKIERHTGRPVELKAWQRRWPLLAAPGVVWRLLRERRLR